MIANSLSPCITTPKAEESRDFYVQHFGAKVTFDCGWYVNLEFGSKSSSLQFIAPQPNQPLCNPAGLVAIMPLEDHSWGDRGFAIQDPNGIVLYTYSERAPSSELKQYYKS